MQRLLEVSEFKKQRYAGKKPSIDTLKRWIDSGKLPGKKEGNLHFVYIDLIDNKPEEKMLEMVLKG